jgi:ATP-dependent DNA helicase 2 subunit 1
LREDEIGRAFQFGHEAIIRNVLEPNWWETSNVAQRQEIADEVVRQEQDRRRRIEAGQEEEEDVKEVKRQPEPERIIARTRVRSSDLEHSLTTVAIHC